MENVAVVGASPKVGRYSNKAMRMLEMSGHNFLPAFGLSSSRATQLPVDKTG